MTKGIRVIRHAAGARLPEQLLKAIPYSSHAVENADETAAFVGREALFAERMRRLQILAEHMGAKFRGGDKDGVVYEYALIRLAVEFVPGFRTISPSGAKVGRAKKWSSQRRAELLRRVDDVKARISTKTDEAACKWLVDRGEFQEGSRNGTTDVALTKRLSEARSDSEAVELAYGRPPINILSSRK